MIECLLAWSLLFVGIATQDANYFIASGIFAVATQIWLCRTKGGGDK